MEKTKREEEEENSPAEQDPKLSRSTTLTALTRFGDAPPQLLKRQSIALNRVPKPTIPGFWTADWPRLLVLQSAVFSGSMRPVATVREVVRVESAGADTQKWADIQRWAARNPEILGGFLGEVKWGVRRGKRAITGLERRVRELETETWDREGAVEDLGGAKRGPLTGPVRVR